MAYSALTDKIWLPTEADFATNAGIATTD
jgi:hypothetical protein